eukprot:g505.t1
MSQWSLKGEACLVTGGSKGIGYATARELLDHDADLVVICARNPSALQEKVKELNQNARGKCYGVICDISTESGRSSLLASYQRHFQTCFPKEKSKPRLDVLVNNVGTNKRTRIEDCNDGLFQTMITTNLESCFKICRDFHNLLKQSSLHHQAGEFDTAVSSSSSSNNGTRATTRRRRPRNTGARIINVSSAAGVRSSGTGICYGMTKGGMNQLTRALACEWGALGVRVNAVAPWMTFTPLLEQAFREDPRGETRDQVREATRWTPLQRLAEPEEIADAIVFLALPASSYITGQVLSVDGGLTAQGFRGPCVQEMSSLAKLVDTTEDSVASASL